MTIEETRNKILTDSEFILEEAHKLLYIYTLKHVIRFGASRHDTDFTESVAEHIFGMYVIADYFLPLEDTKNELDRSKIYQLITWHEGGEIETGDIPAINKTEADREYERNLIPKVISQMPAHISLQVKELMEEYEDQSSPEAKFAKAVDKIEPLIHSLDTRSKPNQHNLRISTEASQEVKAKYIKNYPCIQAFSDTLHSHMDREGYFFVAS